MKKVMCFGTFDLLHLGHLDYFKQAKKHGDYLIVVIARDATKKIQKKESIFSEKERLHLVQSVGIVDEAVLGNIQDHFKIIEEKKPDILCLGYDHHVDAKVLSLQLQRRGLNPQIKRMKPYRSNKNKSSLLKEIIFKS